MMGRCGFNSPVARFFIRQVTDDPAGSFLTEGAVVGAATSDADFDDRGFTLPAGLVFAVVGRKIVLHLPH